MFDDQNSAAGGTIPSNLPIAEPDDMFAGASPSAQAVPEPPAPPSAVSAGVLKPKLAADDALVRPNPPVPSSLPPIVPDTNSADLPPNYGVRPPDNVMSEPLGGRKVLYTLVIVIAVVILGGGGAWIYFSFINPSQNTVVPVVNKQVAPVLPTNTTPPPVVAPAPSAVSEPTTTPDERILFGEPILDTDSDGLDDTTEKKIGTDYLKWDTDADGLSDGDEVLTWKTDPLKADTDGDTYTDSAEIKNGYNPKGTGKLFPVNPVNSTSTTSTAVK